MKFAGIIVLLVFLFRLPTVQAQVQGAVNNNLSHGWREMSGLGDPAPSGNISTAYIYSRPTIFDTNGQTGIRFLNYVYVFDTISCIYCSDYSVKNVYLIEKNKKIGLFLFAKTWESTCSGISPVFDEIIYTASTEPNPRFWDFFVVKSNNKYGVCAYGIVRNGFRDDQFTGDMILECVYDDITVIEKKFLSRYMVIAKKDDILYEFDVKCKGSENKIKQIKPPSKK